MAFEKQLTRIININDPKEQNISFQTLIDEVLASRSSSIDNVKSIVSKLLSEDLNQQVSKTLLACLCRQLKNESISSMSTSDTIPWEDLWQYIISSIKQHGQYTTVLYDESDYICRECLFTYYLSCEQFSEAAHILSMVNLESTSKSFTDKEKADILIKCSEAYLEDDETIEAEIFVTKASVYINNVVDDVSLQLRYRTTFARILDANRKFVEAASRYYELSTTTFADINQDDLLLLLGKAVTCTLLGKTGTQRSRIINLLCKDERLTSLEQFSQFASHASLLRKMHQLQLLPNSELLIFESSLMPHQQAISSDGLTIIQKAVLEHNMLAVQELYDNISLDQLGRILGLDTHTAIKIAAKMITEERLTGYIDQTEGYLVFQDPSNSTPMRQWDSQIAILCDEVTSFVDVSLAKYPGAATAAVL